MKRNWMFVAMFVIATASIPETEWGQTRGSPGEVVSPAWSFIGPDSVSQLGFGQIAVTKKGTILGGTSWNYIQRSTNMGASWTQIDYRNGLTAELGTIEAILVLPYGDILVCGGGVFKSTDDGMSWRQVGKGFGSSLLRTRKGDLISGSGGIGSAVYKSTDNGDTWFKLADSVLTTASGIIGFTETRTGTILGVTLAAYDGDGIIRSTDGGKTWAHIKTDALLNDFVAIATDPGSYPEKLYAMSYISGAYVSEDDGLTWRSISEIPEKKGGTVFATSYQGFFLGFEPTRDREAVYQLIGGAYRPLGFPRGYMVLSGCQYDDRRILFGTNSGAWLATYPPVTSVEGDIPTSFSLSQNYPNPFNPSTTIEFSVPKRSDVNITIWNAIGQKIEALVDGEKEAGNYRIVWNAGKYPSGIYFAHLETGNGFKSSVKMLLVK